VVSEKTSLGRSHKEIFEGNKRINYRNVWEKTVPGRTANSNQGAWVDWAEMV
jgi:hypothetical protein